LIGLLAVALAVVLTGCGFHGGPPHSFAVIQVIDGKSVQLRELDQEPQVYPYELTPFVELKGVWSDKARGPASSYDARVHFLAERLLQTTVRAPTHYQVVQNPNEAPRVIRYVEKPAEIMLADGSNLTKELLRLGYAIVDPTDQRLSGDEIKQYQA